MRYQWSGRATLVADTPHFLGASADDRIRVDLHVSSRRLPRGRFASQSAAGRFRTLVHVVPVEPAGAGAAAAGDGAAAAGGGAAAAAGLAPSDEATRLWSEYVATRLSRPSARTDASSLVRVAAELRLPELRGALRSLLDREKSPSVRAQILGQLLELGAAEAEPLVQGLLGEGTPAERLAVARTLASAGVASGARSCIALIAEHRDALRSQTSAAMSSVQAYMARHSDDEETRRLVQRTLAQILAGDDFRAVMPYVARFAGGEDFGYREALRGAADQRDRAMREAAGRARAWFLEESSSRGE
jgi:hypothetical protein